MARGGNFIKDEFGILHLNGVPWYDAPIPRRFHRCFVQTDSRNFLTNSVQRCACGGVRFGFHYLWMDKNSRRKSASHRNSRNR